MSLGTPPPLTRLGSDPLPKAIAAPGLTSALGLSLSPAPLSYPPHGFPRPGPSHLDPFRDKQTWSEPSSCSPPLTPSPAPTAPELRELGQVDNPLSLSLLTCEVG